MSNVKNFVSENEIEEAKKQRQAEWERVRKPEDPIEAPEPSDNRCLYERLKEQREKKQAEQEEAQRLKHMVRGLDSEEAGFLDYVDDMKAAEERQRRLEEKQLIQEIVKARETEKLQELPLVTASTSSKKLTETKPKVVSKQAQLVSSVIVKRKSGDSKISEDDVKKSKLNDSNSVNENDREDSKNAQDSSKVSKVRVAVGRRPTAIVTLPGLDAYSDAESDSDSSDSSNSSSDDLSAATNGLSNSAVKRKIIVEMKSNVRNA